MRLLRNAARCEGCGDTIESKHHWQYVSCTCGALSVDGGLDYARRMYDSNIPWTDLSERAE